MMSFQDHFRPVSTQYGQHRPTYPDTLFDWLAAHCGRRDLAWDCACGTGQAAVPLATRFARVLATDASEAQVAQAPATPGVTWQVEPAETSSLPDRSVDLVTVAQALHWFDVETFHGEVLRVLRPDGLVAEWTYGILHVEGHAVDAVLQRYYWNEVGAHWPPERRHVENGYRDLPFPFTPVAAPPFAMVVRWTLAELIGYVRTWSATTRCQKATGIDPVPGLEAKLAEAWGPVDQRRRVEWPLSLRAGRPPAAGG